MKIRVIGGGLAGPEAALTAARLGCQVDLYEMRTVVDGKPRLTPAHQTTEFGELVCSNSLKSESPNTAPWLLKQEMRRGRSVLLRLQMHAPCRRVTRWLWIAWSFHVGLRRRLRPSLGFESFAKR